ncbi:UDP-glycosyltransferase 82A1, partial [Cucurbita argyrosperma subsp. argyrosperma]
METVVQHKHESRTTKGAIRAIPDSRSRHTDAHARYCFSQRRGFFLSIFLTLATILHSHIFVRNFTSPMNPLHFYEPDTVPSYVRRVLGEYNSNGSGVVCMVVDLLASSAIEVGKEYGVAVAGFWPAMFATYNLISAVPDMVKNNLISSDTGCPEEGSKRCVPNQPLLSTEELPWLIGTSSARKARFKFWTRTMVRAKSLQWILVNSFPEELPLENPIPKSSAAVFLVGPLSRHSNPAKTPTFWEEDDGCLQWLEKQSPNSVVYISFGSWVSPINESKVRSLAVALLGLRKPFIWVLKSNWRDGLPIGFTQKMEILKHRAVSCYLTHCGWNSIMEAIQCRKRLLCFPVAGDQFLNCGYVVKVWRIGLKLNGFGEKEVEEGVRKVMEDGEMKVRLMKLHERIMGEEANSRVNSSFTTFIKDINNLSFGKFL